VSPSPLSPSLGLSPRLSVSAWNAPL
jgi:hypothetical protein